MKHLKTLGSYIIKITQSNAHLLLQSTLVNVLPARQVDAHKGTFGSVAIIGGGMGMIGAVLLSARAALLSGTGRIYVSYLASDAPSVDILHPEIMFRKPADLTSLSQLDSVVIGPGLGQSQAAIKLLEFWLSQNVAMLIDADGLNLLAKHPRLAAICKNRSAETVITPHAAEAARLLGKSSENIQQSRTESALKLARDLHATCVLKGANTVVAHDDNYFINTTGNVGLASGGTGDVLSGIIGSFLAQGLSGLDAAKMGVFVHGAAADALVAKGIGPAGLTASEVSIEARNIINQLSLN
ncbi:MAG: NAD(P)H-hydrate dehydratase [Methylotenera sp.]|uniref:NAD(P)H-hydrate dehydratase n=1 Tax=Methylotenera sp. TaxID=2051956 RepID=UPI0024884698|nr:NAD(P)H-hydrate dehydratase [Methylotenera sp.]MDI1308414.1 NAD(P)H-hydrate dehydratase [Methylotenera sp.]